MFYVYVLISKSHKNKSYVGMTIKKPEVRLLEHNKGLSKYTRTFLPWEVLYYETFFCRVCAEKRERYLKSGKGYKLKKMIIKHRKELS